MSKIILAEQASAPDTPGADKVAIFVDANGDLAWKDDAGNVTKIAAAGSYTLTIPATGTAALLNVAQTFSAVKTFDNALVAPGMKPASDSTTALQLQTAGGTAVLTVDTTNSKVDLAALKIGGVDVPYAVGTWTPALLIGGSATGITYSVQAGDYIRFGALCFVRAEITLSNKGASTGTVDLSGLPIAAATTNRGGLTVEYFANFASAATGIYARVASTTARLAAAGADLTQANLNNNSVLRIWGVYQV